MSLEEALARRRSIRELSGEPLTIAEIGQLLWAAQGVTDAQGRRTAPSAGALYPLELYAVTPQGVFHYLPAQHAIQAVRDGDLRPRLRSAAFDQAPIGDAPLVVVVAGVTARTAAKYGTERARRYVDLEAGHAAQNLLLEAVALGLGGVPIGAFDDAAVSAVVGLGSGEEPLYLLAVGHPR
jgi:SagB-type dehydrogenase family enzyme